MRSTRVGTDRMRLVFWEDQMFQDTPEVLPRAYDEMWTDIRRASLDSISLVASASSIISGN